MQEDMRYVARRMNIGTDVRAVGHPDDRRPAARPIAPDPGAGFGRGCGCKHCPPTAVCPPHLRLRLFARCSHQWNLSGGEGCSDLSFRHTGSLNCGLDTAGARGGRHRCGWCDAGRGR